MKKSLIVLLAILTLAIFTGCSKDKEESVDLDVAAVVQESFQGIVNEIPSEISGVNATHQMTTSTGEIVYLRSVLFDLSKFEGSELRVTGSVSKEDVSGVEITVLSVESRDLISVNEVKEEKTELNFEDKGFSLEVENDLYEISEGDKSVKLESENLDVEITPNLKGLELDLSLFIDDNYGDEQVPQTVLNSNGDRFSRITLGSDKLVYLKDSDSVIYEVSFRSYLDSQAETAQLIDDILEGIDFDPLSLKMDNDIELNPDVEEEGKEDESEETKNNDSSNATIVEPVDLGDLSESSSNNVEKFLASKGELIGNDSSIESFGFTEDGYVYVSFVNNDVKLRNLFKFENDNFSKIAEFKEGIETDWELVSGENLAFNKALTMVFVEEEGYREVFLSEGYRYFESRPLSFGLHYPKNWYYAREGDAYLFSDKPIGETETLVEVEVIDDSFASVNGDKISSSIMKKSTGSSIDYFVKKDEGGTFKVSGNSSNSEELEIMAKTLTEVK